jgi:hypothetical protein
MIVEESAERLHETLMIQGIPTPERAWIEMALGSTVQPSARGSRWVRRQR